MILKLRAAVYGSIVLFMLNFPAKSQVKEIKPTLFDGFIVAGYTGHGAYINCTGPVIKYTHKPLIVMIGLLPSLKIKEDKALNNAPKNSIITPTLGFGLTAAYKHFVWQGPFFYNSKTSNSNGKWNAGVGIGYKF